MLNVREQVVDNVVLDDAVEEVTPRETKLAVDCRESALDESPVLRIVMGNLHVGVMQICDGNCIARLAA